MVNFSVAVNRKYKDRQGNVKEDTDWYRVCAFNGIGSACAQFLSRGSAVFLEGRLQVRTYDSKNGEQVSVEIIPSVVRFLGSPRGVEDATPRPGQPRSAKQDPSPEREEIKGDGDAPF